MGNVLLSCLNLLQDFIVNNEYGLVIVVAVSLCCIICVFCCCYKMCRSKRPVTSESFKWPNSKRFLKRASPSDPPQLVVPKYEDPLRTDELPEGEERFWTLTYQPNGERVEVEQQIYLTFRDGKVFGVGYEKVRKLCKIKGKYRYNAAARQVVLVMDCWFSNERDHVLLHGTGNGTAVIGNCYIHEIDPFGFTSGIPKIRKRFGDKFKGSFMLQMNASMGDHHLRQMLHTRRVHKFAGSCFPDEAAPRPESPLRRLSEEELRHEGSGETDSTRDGSTFDGSQASPARGTKRWWKGKFFRAKRRNSGNSGSGAAGTRSPVFTRVPRGVASSPGVPYQEHVSGVEMHQEVPAWSRNVARTSPAAISPPGSGRRTRRSPAHGRLPSAPQGNLGVNELNYLEVDAIPGRSGPAMV